MVFCLVLVTRKKKEKNERTWKEGFAYTTVIRGCLKTWGKSFYEACVVP